MNKRRKALSVALASALLIPALTLTAFADSNAELYGAYIRGNTILGETYTLTDPAARDMYNDLIFVTGEPGSASASGYGSFYNYRGNSGKYGWTFGYANPVTGGDGGTHTLDEIQPIGNIKWVLHDGVLVVTNDWTDEEIEAQVNHSASESLQQAARNTMTTTNFLNYHEAYLELTPFRNNANIETIIFGENIDINYVEDVFVNCTNIKNIILLDGGFYNLVEGSNPEYIIVRETQTSGALPAGNSKAPAEEVAYLSSDDRMDFVDWTPGSKGNVTIGQPTYTPPYGGQAGTDKWTYPDAATVASQYATAKQYIADMDLPDWALAFIPTSMGGTGTARVVEDVFNFQTAQLKSDWADSTGTVTDTPVTEPEVPAATTVTYSDWAEGDIMMAGMAGYLDTLPASNAPAVTDLLGSDFTKPITRGQFAALAVRYYETLMSSLTETDYIIPVDTGDDVFADSTGNEAIAKAYNLGLIGGYNSAPDRSGVNIGPDDLITREQAATMLTRLMEQLSDDFSEIGRTGWSVYRADNLPFTDTISDWALDGVKAMYGNGVMTGTSGTTFSPKGNYTIEQSIVTLMRIDGWANMGMGA